MRKIKVVPTELHIWKIWLNGFIQASDSNKWYLYVLAPTASRAAKVAVAYWKGEHAECVVVSVKLVCSSIILEPAIIVKCCAEHEKEREEEIQWRKDIHALRVKSESQEK